MNTEPTTNPSVADLARLVNCLDEQSVAKLAGVQVSTLDAWRKRGKGPEYVLLGRNYLYPIAGVQSHISSIVRARSGFDARKALM
ncbi:hypothetical protein [Massilia phyllosphaerae]|uniref:hypothetical protein n=1 Tax=Massilia phyllosphaerae TaxID=3106034 RepID=UPI002B1CAA7A|nr:hypothetical protein [Massilia sp. SGZ-792]